MFKEVSKRCLSSSKYIFYKLSVLLRKKRKGILYFIPLPTYLSKYTSIYLRCLKKEGIVRNYRD